MGDDNWYRKNQRKNKGKVYKCEFPQCNYTTSVRTQIHFHHIIPREHGGSNKTINKISLCPTHHTKIYNPKATKGMHANKSEDSIILIGWRTSTIGKVLHYIENDEEKFL